MPGKRQHYVPRFMLRRFAVDPADKRSLIFRLDKRTGRNQRVNPTNEAVVGHYYRIVGEDGTVDNTADEALDRVETMAAEVIAKLAGRAYTVTGDDVERLMLFIVTLKQRTPQGREGLGEADARTGELYLEMMLSDREHVHRVMRGDTELSSVPVLSAAPTAYFVTGGDTGLKQTTEAAWQGVNLVAEEIAALIPIPVAVLDDAAIDIWAELKPALAEAVGRVLDLAVLLGTDKPSSWPEAIIPATTAVGNVEAGGATPDKGGVAEDLNQMLALVEADGFDPTALALARPLRSVLRSARGTDGQKLADVSSGSYEGVPISWAGSDVLGNAKALAGDYQMGIIGMRQDMRLEVSDSAIVQDAAGNVIYNAWQQDAVVGRLTFRAAFAVANPITRREPSETGNPYPFALLGS